MNEKGLRDVDVDVSWALGKFYSSFYFFLSN